MRWTLLKKVANYHGGILVPACHQWEHLSGPDQVEWKDQSNKTALYRALPGKRREEKRKEEKRREDKTREEKTRQDKRTEEKRREEKRTEEKRTEQNRTEDELVSKILWQTKYGQQQQGEWWKLYYIDSLTSSDSGTKSYKVQCWTAQYGEPP